MKFKLNEMLVNYDDTVEFPLDAWDLYEELILDYSDREIIQLLIKYDFLPDDMLEKYDNDEVDMFDDVISVMDEMSSSDIERIPEFQEVVYTRLIPKIKDELTLDVPYNYKGDWE